MWGRGRTAGAVAAVVLAGIAPAGGGPEDVTDVERVFPEPLARTRFIQFTPDPVTGRSEYLDGIAELEERYPAVIDVTPIGDLVGMPGVTSVGGRALPVITVTDR